MGFIKKNDTFIFKNFYGLFLTISKISCVVILCLISSLSFSAKEATQGNTQEPPSISIVAEYIFGESFPIVVLDDLTPDEKAQFYDFLDTVGLNDNSLFDNIEDFNFEQDFENDNFLKFRQWLGNLSMAEVLNYKFRSEFKSKLGDSFFESNPKASQFMEFLIKKARDYFFTLLIPYLGQDNQNISPFKQLENLPVSSSIRGANNDTIWFDLSNNTLNIEAKLGNAKNFGIIKFKLDSSSFTLFNLSVHQPLKNAPTQNKTIYNYPSLVFGMENIFTLNGTKEIKIINKQIQTFYSHLAPTQLGQFVYNNQPTQTQISFFEHVLLSNYLTFIGPNFERSLSYFDMLFKISDFAQNIENHRDNYSLQESVELFELSNINLTADIFNYPELAGYQNEELKFKKFVLLALSQFLGLTGFDEITEGQLENIVLTGDHGPTTFFNAISRESNNLSIYRLSIAYNNAKPNTLFDKYNLVFQYRHSIGNNPDLPHTIILEEKLDVNTTWGDRTGVVKIELFNQVNPSKLNSELRSFFKNDELQKSSSGNISDQKAQEPTCYQSVN